MTTQPRFRLSGPTIDAADPLRLARFYERLLVWSIVEQEGWGRGPDDAGVVWAEECGARQADHQPQDDVRVMIDPEGHPFCLFLDSRA